jgi:hypothetical protein
VPLLERVGAVLPFEQPLDDLPGLVATRRDQLARRQDTGGDQAAPGAGLRILLLPQAGLGVLLGGDASAGEQDLFEPVAVAVAGGADQPGTAQIQQRLLAITRQGEPAGAAEPVQEHEEVGDAERLETSSQRDVGVSHDLGGLSWTLRSLSTRLPPSDAPRGCPPRPSGCILGHTLNPQTRRRPCVR